MRTLMRTAKWIALVAVIIAIGVIAFMIGRAMAPKTTESTIADDAAEAAPAREQIYTCPMHPQVRTTDPNELCPICAMELVPLEDDDDDADDGELPRLRVSARAMALMNVQTVPARRAMAEREVRLYGRIEEDERRVKTITAWAPGRLDRLHVDFTGQRVERDQPMVELYSPKLIAAQEELLQAIRAERELRNTDGLAAQTARRSIEAARDRLRLYGVGPLFVDDLETTGRVRENIAIPAPLDGVVIRRFARLGDYVSTGDRLYDIADLSHLWMQLSVFESDLPWLREGQTAIFTMPSLPGETFEGTVAFINPVLDDRTRSVRVRIDLPNKDSLLKPGMFASGVVKAALDRDGRVAANHDHAHDQSARATDPPLVIPASAPLITGRRAVVYVKLRDTERPTFEARDVLLGPRAGDQFVVFEGVEEGELVVVNGQFRIDSELQIRGRPSMMQPAAEEDPPAPIVPHHHAALSILPNDVPDAFASQLADVLDDYLALSDAMSQDDYDTARAIAHEMHERLYEVDSGEINERVRDAWEALDRDLHEHLHAMLDAADLESIRPPLEPLTEFVALMVAHFIGDRAGTVYRAHCPMVDDFRGADWLQRETAIANPYFGSQMFRCGEIVGEVKYEEVDDASEAPEQTDAPVEIALPDDFGAAVRDLLDMHDEIANAIEHGHEQHARHAARSMQDALFALELDALDEAMTQAWLRADVEIMDALRAIIEADSTDAMRHHLPHLRESVEIARELIEHEGGHS